jgi:hypothetical protein
MDRNIQVATVLSLLKDIPRSIQSKPRSIQAREALKSTKHSNERARMAFAKAFLPCQLFSVGKSSAPENKEERVEVISA